MTFKLVRSLMALKTKIYQPFHTWGLWFCKEFGHKFLFFWSLLADVIYEGRYSYQTLRTVKCSCFLDDNMILIARVIYYVGLYCPSLFKGINHMLLLL